MIAALTLFDAAGDARPDVRDGRLVDRRPIGSVRPLHVDPRTAAAAVLVDAGDGLRVAIRVTGDGIDVDLFDVGRHDPADGVYDPYCAMSLGWADLAAYRAALDGQVPG